MWWWVSVAFAADVHPTAVVHRTAELGADVVVGEGAIIGANAVIEADVRVGAFAVVGPLASVGARTILGERASVGRSARVGADSRIDGRVGPEADVGQWVEVAANAQVFRGATVGDGVLVDVFATVGRDAVVEDTAVLEIGARIRAFGRLTATSRLPASEVVFKREVYDAPACPTPSPSWVDADGDGTGDPARGLAWCVRPSGWADDPTDCDDTNPARVGLTNGCRYDVPVTTCAQLRGTADDHGTGQYGLAANGGHFTAWCDMVTAGGGWTLIYKQSGHASGRFVHDDAMRGHSALLNEQFGATSPQALTGLPHSELLFKNSATVWVRTDGMSNWQHWTGGARYCRRRSAGEMTTGPGLSLWADTSFQLMTDGSSTISGITIARWYSMQASPQCGEPHCQAGSARHGRYNGGCQNNTAGLGDWMVFSR